MGPQLVQGFVFAVAIAAASRILGVLSWSGSAAQFVLGWLLLGLGGWEWTLPMLAFFLTSSLLSYTGSSRKHEARAYFEKTGKRDAAQVLANGGVAGVLLLCWFWFQWPALYFAYVGSVAAANADTWGTEAGLLSSGQPRLITTLNRVERGRSGGISPVGTAAGLLGALVIGVSAFPWSSGSGVLVSGVSGIMGTCVDSLVGATLQGEFRCGRCGRLTERRVHCGHQAVLEKGLIWVGNDLTNLLCTLTGSVIGWLVFGFMQ